MSTCVTPNAGLKRKQRSILTVTGLDGVVRSICYSTFVVVVPCFKCDREAVARILRRRIFVAVVSLCAWVDVQKLESRI